MTNLSQELNVALKALERAQKEKCLCSQLVRKFGEPCTCPREQSIKLAQMQVETVRDAIKEANRRETA